MIEDYVPQPDAYTCQSACIAKMIGTQDVAGIRRGLLEIGTPGDPAVMAQYLKPRVKEYHYSAIASLNECKQWLDQGYQLITHGWFTGSGHVISLVDHDAKGFIVDDPWAEFDFPSWQYTGNTNGNDLHYSFKGIYIACVVSHSRGEAESMYSANIQPDMNFKNAWVHRIKN